MLKSGASKLHEREAVAAEVVAVVDDAVLHGLEKELRNTTGDGGADEARCSRTSCLFEPATAPPPLLYKALSYCSVSVLRRTTAHYCC